MENVDFEILRSLDFELNYLNLYYIKQQTQLWSENYIKKRLKCLTKILNLVDINKEMIKLCELINYDIDCKIRVMDTSIIRGLKFTTPFAGSRVLNWLKWIDAKLTVFKNDEYPTIDDYIDCTCWNYKTGFVNEYITFQAIYFNYDFNGKTVNISYLFKEACNNCSVDIIKDIWNISTDNDKHCLVDNLLSLRTKEKDSMYLIYYWIRILAKPTESSADYPLENKYYQLTNDFEMSYDNINMMLLCVTIGNDVAFEYFFQQLNQDLQKNILIRIVILIFSQKNFYLFDESNHLKHYSYLKNKLMNIFLFVWIKMTTTMRAVCFNRFKSQIRNMIFSEWPSSEMYNKFIKVIIQPPPRTISISWSKFKLKKQINRFMKKINNTKL